jgi:superfamily II DNA or RNA helicase
MGDWTDGGDEFPFEEYFTGQVKEVLRNAEYYDGIMNDPLMMAKVRESII